MFVVTTDNFYHYKKKLFLLSSRSPDCFGSLHPKKRIQRLSDYALKQHCQINVILDSRPGKSCKLCKRCLWTFGPKSRYFEDCLILDVGRSVKDGELRMDIGDLR